MGAVGGDTVDPAPAAPEPSRLHPLTVLKELGSLTWALVGALLVPFDAPFLPGGLVDPETFAAAAVFGYAVLRYLVTSYTVSPQALELRRGVLVRRRQTMRRDRIQTVDVRTDLLGRVFDVRTVEVSAADTEQIEVSYVSRRQAARLRRLLDPPEQPPIGVDQAGGSVPAAAPAQPSELPALFVLTPRAWLTFTVTQTSFWLAMAGLVAASGLVLVRGGSFLVVSLLPVLVAPFFSAVSFVGFRSWVHAGRLGVVRGLINRRETTTPLPRIQALVVTRPPLRRLSGYETVGVTSGDVSGSSEGATGSRIVAPLATRERWPHLGRAVGVDVDLAERDLRRPSVLTIRRAMVKGLVATAAMTVLAAGLARSQGVGAVIALLVVPVGAGLSLWYARLRYRALGWVADDRHVLLRQGVVTRSLAAVPVGKVQDVTVQATFFQRRLGIATVVVDTAGATFGHHLRAVDLPAADASGLARHLAVSAARVYLPDGV